MRHLAIFLVALLVVVSANAQIDTGAIVGTVHDASGAAIPKAALILTNAATGVTQATVSNDSGEYQFPALPPGTYSVKVNAAGFSSQVCNEIEIHVQSRPSVDFTLKVGEVSEMLEVRTAALL